MPGLRPDNIGISGREGKSNVRENRLVFWFLFCCLFSGSIRVFGQNAPAAPQPTQHSEEDLAHFGDVIDVDVVGGFEYDWRGTLTPEGFLEGLDGFNQPVYALCRSEDEIAAGVAMAYSKILRDPKVIVKIIDRSNRAVVRLDGAVRTPTRFRLKRQVRLRELLVLAGGLLDDTSGEISIFRPRNLSCIPTVSASNSVEKISNLPQDNVSQMMTIKISDLLSGDTAANIQILSGDLIDVSRAVPVYVIGAVNNPRPVYSRAQISVSRAIASAGGLAKEADATKITILRREGVETKTIETDLGKIKRGELDDVILKQFDIIDVASKGGGKRKYPPAIANSAKTDRERRELPLRVVD